MRSFLDAGVVNRDQSVQLKRCPKAQVHTTSFPDAKIPSGGRERISHPPQWAFFAGLIQNLYFDERTRVAEILSVLGNGVAIQAGVAGVLHQILEFFLPPLFP